MFQTRSEENGIHYFKTIGEAIEAARNDKTIWKISFNAENGERIRLITNDEDCKNQFMLSQLADEIYFTNG